LKKAKEAKGKAQEAEGATKVPDNPMQATFQVGLEKAKKAAKNFKGTMTAATSQMFAFFANFEFCQSKVCVEQDRQRADGRRPICGSSRYHSIRPKGNVLQVV
jgi:hypothetical protein